MCGITGFVRSAYLDEPFDPAVTIRAMTHVIAHRGPDADGHLIFDSHSTACHLLEDGPIRADERRYTSALGHRRLAIIDLSPAGRNPMCNEDGTVWIVFNGEIYNFRALREGLLARGHRFSSQADTEVILHLYEEMGPECVRRLNGIFAFALWDARQGRLLLARDRIGIKPLFYTQADDALVFGSEIKALLQFPNVHPALDPIALADHLTFQNMYGARTLFRGVSLLEMGQYLVWERGVSHITTYWTPEFSEDGPKDAETFARELREVFEAATTSQLMSDVPLGTFLSGGMDTGAISAVAARHLPAMHTFTCGFDPTGVSPEEILFDEREDARFLSDHLHTIHHEMMLRPGDMEHLLPSVVWHLEEPRVGISYQVYAVTQLIREHVTVVLSGVGGDELFAGYPWRYERVEGLTDLARFSDRYYHAWVRLLSDERKEQLFADELRRELRGYTSRDAFASMLGRVSATTPINRAMGFDMLTFLQGLLLVDDKLSMAHSVESRVPFLDNAVFDLALQIPGSLKLRDGKGKYILREAMRGLLPDDVITRRKQGFTPPDASWYRGETLRYIEGTLLGEQACSRGLFRPEMVRVLLDEHLAGLHNHRFLIWSMLCLEWWQRIFIDGDVPAHADVSSLVA